MSTVEVDPTIAVAINKCARDDRCSMICRSTRVPYRRIVSMKHWIPSSNVRFHWPLLPNDCWTLNILLASRVWNCLSLLLSSILVPCFRTLCYRCFGYCSLLRTTRSARLPIVIFGIDNRKLPCAHWTERIARIVFQRSQSSRSSCIIAQYFRCSLQAIQIWLWTS